MSFIAPNNWITNAGASIFRNKILSEGEIKSFIDFGDFKVFEDAGIQTMIFVFKKNIPPLEYSVKYLKVIDKKIGPSAMSISLQSEIGLSTNQTVSYEANIIPKQLLNNYLEFPDTKIQTLCNKIKKDKIYLKKEEVATGIDVHQDFVSKSHLKRLSNATIGDGIFILNKKEMQKMKLVASLDELNYIKPFFSTDELGRFYSNPNNKQWVIYTKSDIGDYIDSLPNIKYHLDKYMPVITSDNRPYGLHRARVESFFTGEKIMSLRKCSRPTFTFTNFDCYVSQSYFVIKTERFNLKYLTSLLNSSVIEFWLLNKGKLQGENFQIDKEPLLNIPLVKADDETQLDVSKLHDKIVNLNSHFRDMDKETISFINSRFGTTFKSISDLNLSSIEKRPNPNSKLLLKSLDSQDFEIQQVFYSGLNQKQVELKSLKVEIDSLECQINQKVYELYNLTPEEIEIVESSLEITTLSDNENLINSN